MRVAKEELLLNKMKQGLVYRRSDLVRYSTAVDRHLDRLVKKNEVIKVSSGLYLRPKSSVLGVVPPDENLLIKSFLKDDRFLVNSFNNYNQLGLGLTQIYGHKIVYNYKRFGEFELGGRKYFFKRVPKFPHQLSKEFLVVDMLNNLKELAEDEVLVFENLKKNKENFDKKKVLSLAKEYGRPRTKKFLIEVYNNV
jgi:hypothetical protein